MGEDDLAFVPKDGKDFMPKGGVIFSVMCVNGLGHIIHVSVNIIMKFIYILCKCKCRNKYIYLILCDHVK
jgi:hypothetical protein